MACDPWQFWNQLNDWTLDPDRADENRVNNCGPECCAMLLWHLRGVELSADQVKDWLLGAESTGYTTLAQLRRFLTFQHVRSSFQPAEPATIGQYVDWGQPVIILQQGMVEPRGYWHFVVAIDREGDNLIVANPWGGTRDSITPSAWTGAAVYPTALYVDETRCWGRDDAK